MSRIPLIPKPSPRTSILWVGAAFGIGIMATLAWATAFAHLKSSGRIFPQLRGLLTFPYPGYAIYLAIVMLVSLCAGTVCVMPWLSVRNMKRSLAERIVIAALLGAALGGIYYFACASLFVWVFGALRG